MKLFKTTALALAASAGLALVSAQAFAQNAAYTDTSSVSGNTEVNSFEGSLSSTQITATQTEGDAIAIGIATPIGVGSGGGSEAGGTIQGGGFGWHDNTTTNPQSANNYNGTTTVLDGGGSTSEGGGAHFFSASKQDGSTDTFALNHVHLWADVSHAESQGSATSSDSGATGNALSGLFVFGQTTAVSEDGNMQDTTPVAPTVSVASGDFNGSTGNIALNQVAGVGNQQANNLQTGVELTGANGTVVGSNTVNSEGSQTLADAGNIAANYGSSYESATIADNAFQNVSGAVAFNQAAGVANQQANSMTLLH